MWTTSPALELGTIYDIGTKGSNRLYHYTRLLLNGYLNHEVHLVNIYAIHSTLAVDMSMFNVCPPKSEHEIAYDRDFNTKANVSNHSNKR